MFKFKDKFLKYGLAWMVLLMPLIYSTSIIYPHIAPKTFFIYGAIEILFFVWLYALITDCSYRISKRSWIYFLPAILFVGWLTITSVQGVNFSLSFWSSFSRGTGLLTLYHCLALVFVSVSLFQKNGLNFIKYFFINFFIGSLVGAFTIWLGPGGFNLNIQSLQTGGEGGLIGNSSLAATYMTFSIAFILFFSFDNKASFNLKKLAWIGTVFILLSPLFINLSGLFNNYSLLGTARASFLALFVSVFVYLVILIISSKNSKFKTLGIILSVVSLSVFFILWNQLVTPNTYLNTKFTEQARGSRFIFWDSASQAISDKPILGYGAENFSIVFQKYFNPNILQKENSFEGWVDRAHNIYYEIGVAGGYPAVILYFIFLLGIFLVFCILYRDKKINKKQLALIGSFIVGYIFQNLFIFDSNLSLVSIFLLLGLSIGLHETKEGKGPTTDKNTNREFVLIPILILLCIVLVNFVYMPTQKAKLHLDIFSRAFKSETPNYDQILSGSHIGMGRDVGFSAYLIYQKYVEDLMKIKNNKQELPYTLNNLESLISFLYKAQEQNKTDFRLYMSTVYLENTMTFLTDRSITDDLSNKISQSLSTAHKLSPSHPDVYWTQAQVKVWQGDFKGAEDDYLKAIEVAPTIPSSYVSLLRYAQILGNQNLFNDTMLEAKENIPGFVFTN